MMYNMMIGEDEGTGGFNLNHQQLNRNQEYGFGDENNIGVGGGVGTTSA